MSVLKKLLSESKLILSSILIALVQACSGNSANQAELIQQGKVLVDANDCKTCHHPLTNIIGPSHLDVARKYETTDANVKLLADRIINGSTGVWGYTPMTPHTDLSFEDAKKMVQYVLSLDDQ